MNNHETNYTAIAASFLWQRALVPGAKIASKAIATAYQQGQANRAIADRPILPNSQVLYRGRDCTVLAELPIEGAVAGYQILDHQSKQVINAATRDVTPHPTEYDCITLQRPRSESFDFETGEAIAAGIETCIIPCGTLIRVWRPASKKNPTWYQLDLFDRRSLLVGLDDVPPGGWESVSEEGDRRLIQLES